MLRAVALMANGVTPVEPNPNFIDDVRQAADGKAVILACEGGGTTVPTPSFQWVRPSGNSLIAGEVVSSAARRKTALVQSGMQTCKLSYYALQGKASRSLTAAYR